VLINLLWYISVQLMFYYIRQLFITTELLLFTRYPEHYFIMIYLVMIVFFIFTMKICQANIFFITNNNDPV